MDKAELIRHEIEKRRDHNLAIGNPLFATMAEEDIELLLFIDSLQEEPTTSVWHSAKDEEPIKGRKIIVLTSVCNIADKNISFTGEYIGNGFVQTFNAKEYMNSWAKWAYIDDLFKL